MLLVILLFKVMVVIALAAHYVFAAAFARADVSALDPFEYTALIWAALIGYDIHCESLHHRVQAGSKGPLESQRYYATIEETENETN